METSPPLSASSAQGVVAPAQSRLNGTRKRSGQCSGGAGRVSTRPASSVYAQPANLKDPMRVFQLKLPLAGMYSLVYQNVQLSAGSTFMAE